MNVDCQDCRRPMEKVILFCLPGRFCQHCGLIEGPAAHTPGVAEYPDVGPWLPAVFYEGPYVIGLAVYLAGVCRILLGQNPWPPRP